MNHNTKVLTAILTSLGTLLAGPLPAADEALLDVLLKNGVITKVQRDALLIVRLNQKRLLRIENIG
jgi:hypothetical protein